MKKVLAVSGGIDSVVMLHLFRDDPDAIVAHFDHGMRPSSYRDARFVEGLAATYGLPFELGHGELDEGASEEAARNARYAFLRRLADEYHGAIFTAHHTDDAIETVVINMLRGTGWRGLAPFFDRRNRHPLLGWDKRKIINYAAEHGLRYRLDQSNSDDKYLRNRVREKLRDLPERERWWLLQYMNRQSIVRRQTEEAVNEILEEVSTPVGNVDMSSGRKINAVVHIEVEREVFQRLSLRLGAELVYRILEILGRSATRPQTQRLLKAIRTLPSGKKYNLAKDYFVEVRRKTVVF